MNGLSDSLTVGFVLALLFGAIAFYLYTRIGQIEKRVSLTENILLDLKMATENTLMAMSSPSHEHDEHEDHRMVHEVERVEVISAPQPVEQNEVEEVNEEDFYKTVMEQAAKNAGPAVPVSESQKMEVNYESMTLKELKEEAKRKGVKIGANPHKKDIIDALKRTGSQGQTSVLEPVPGTDMELEEGFPVEMTN